MSTRKTTVTGTNGTRFTLSTDDTFTLAFARWEESTPNSLRARVCERSLRRIAERSPDGNEQSKARRALGMEA